MSGKNRALLARERAAKAEAELAKQEAEYKAFRKEQLRKVREAKREVEEAERRAFEQRVFEIGNEVFTRFGVTQDNLANADLAESALMFGVDEIESIGLDRAVEKLRDAEQEAPKLDERLAGHEAEILDLFVNRLGADSEADVATVIKLLGTDGIVNFVNNSRSRASY